MKQKIQGLKMSENKQHIHIKAEFRNVGYIMFFTCYDIQRFLVWPLDGSA